jgi:hypothetical protein
MNGGGEPYTSEVQVDIFACFDEYRPFVDVGCVVRDAFEPPAYEEEGEGCPISFELRSMRDHLPESHRVDRRGGMMKFSPVSLRSRATGCTSAIRIAHSSSLLISRLLISPAAPGL